MPVETPNGLVELAVGQVWRTRNCGVVTITNCDGHSQLPWNSNHGESYTDSGTVWSVGQSHRDLIELIAPAQETRHEDGTITKVVTIPVTLPAGVWESHEPSHVGQIAGQCALHLNAKQPPAPERSPYENLLAKDWEPPAHTYWRWLSGNLRLWEREPHYECGGWSSEGGNCVSMGEFFDMFPACKPPLALHEKVDLDAYREELDKRRASR